MLIYQPSAVCVKLLTGNGMDVCARSMRPRYRSGLQKHASGSVIRPYAAYYGLSKLRDTARTTTVRPDENNP